MVDLLWVGTLRVDIHNSLMVNAGHPRGNALWCERQERTCQQVYTASQSDDLRIQGSKGIIRCQWLGTSGSYYQIMLVILSAQLVKVDYDVYRLESMVLVVQLKWVLCREMSWYRWKLKVLRSDVTSYHPNVKVILCHKMTKLSKISKRVGCLLSNWLLNPTCFYQCENLILQDE